MVQQTMTDVVVVGSGMAGLCASLSALEQGARSVVLEKGSRFGGSMRLSSGLIWTFVEKARLRERIPNGNAALQDLVVDGLSDGLSWLERHGVAMEPEDEFMSHGRGRRTDAADLAAVLAERVRAFGGELAPQTPLDTLLHRDGAVRGVRVHKRERVVDIEAGAVVLATGGFQGNPELLARYVTPYVDRVYLRANPWSTGDAFIAATRIGAAVTPGMSGFYGHSLPAPPTRFDSSELAAVTQRYGPVAIAINLDGRRFTDESAGTGEEHLNQAIASQRDATAIYIVDATIAETPLRHGPLARIAMGLVRARGGPVIESQSLEELCTALREWGVAGANALATLRDYNRTLADGRPEQLDPARSDNRFPLATPPFTAVAVRPGITFTSGGLEVDIDMRVLRRSTSSSTLPLMVAEHSEIRLDPIPNLYAAGSDVGNVSSGGYMGGLATALSTGRIAGRAAAIRARSGGAPQTA